MKMKVKVFLASLGLVSVAAVAAPIAVSCASQTQIKEEPIKVIDYEKTYFPYITYRDDGGGLSAILFYWVQLNKYGDMKILIETQTHLLAWSYDPKNLDIEMPKVAWYPENLKGIYEAAKKIIKYEHYIGETIYNLPFEFNPIDNLHI